MNKRKGDTDAVEFLRTIYRENFLSEQEFSKQLKMLDDICSGRLKLKINLFSTRHAAQACVVGANPATRPRLSTASARSRQRQRARFFKGGTKRGRKRLKTLGRAGKMAVSKAPR